VVITHEACRLGCEGIVSRRLGSPYRSGVRGIGVKVKNPAAPAVKREPAGGLRTLKQKGRDLHGLLISSHRGTGAQAAFL